MKIKVVDAGYRDELGALHDAIVSVDGKEYAVVFALAMGWIDGAWMKANLNYVN